LIMSRAEPTLLAPLMFSLFSFSVVFFTEGGWFSFLEPLFSWFWSDWPRTFLLLPSFPWPLFCTVRTPRSLRKNFL
jgi:hypothetical protein